MTPTADVDYDLHLPVAAQPSLESVLELGIHAETMGYDHVWMPETWGRDAVTTLATLAERTDTIGLGTSIVPVYSRSAALIGQTAATLQEATSNRFRLGLGPSGPTVVEHWHSTDFDRPLRRTREYIEAVRAVCSGDTVDYTGDTVTMNEFRLRFDPPSPPPIDVAGMGPKAVELAGRFADGWHALLFTEDGLETRLTDLHRGAKLGDRDPSQVRTMAVVPCCALPDGERARTLTRRHIAFYLGAMGPFYREALTRQGYEDTVETVAAAWSDGDRERAVSAIEDSLIDSLCAAGTPSHARTRLDAIATVDGVDAIAISFPRGADRATIEETIEALAPGT